MLDCIFITTLIALFGARLVYFLLNLTEFHYNVLQFPLLWKYHGLSLMGSIMGGCIGLLVVTRRTKLPFWQLFDIVLLGLLPVVALVGIGGLLGGQEVGRLVHVGNGVNFVGFEGARYPIGLYELIFGLIGYMITVRIAKRYDTEKRVFGIVGLMIAVVGSIFFFTLAFFKEESVYLGSLSFNQIVLAVVLLLTTVLLYRKLELNISAQIIAVYRTVRKLHNK